MQIARRKNRFVMEAVWTRFIPAFQRVVDIIQSGGIGDVVSIDVDFGFDGSDSPSRLTDPSLAGGALYDIGTYALHLGTLFAQPPSQTDMPEIIHTTSNRRENGVDETFTAILRYPTSVCLPSPLNC